MSETQHQARKIYPGRATFDFDHKREVFQVCSGGHVLAECEDSEVADYICKQWNAQPVAEPAVAKTLYPYECTNCGHPHDSAESAKYCLCMAEPTVASDGKEVLHNANSVKNSRVDFTQEPSATELGRQCLLAYKSTGHIPDDLWERAWSAYQREAR